MAFEQKNFTQIFEAMRDRTASNLSDFQTGSVVRSLYESFAYEMAILYEQMQRVYLSAYVDTAEEFDLDKVVAVLGIKRGEPDYATGIVSFERDLGLDENITIPLGTLVTTEDTEDSPKKAYKTIELQVIPPTETSITVRVQAIQPGETEVTKAETITIMPQPIPGVKVVNNPEAIVFTGKLRETDEQLRERAKKTLLAASNANTTSIENALLSLPGVREVKVRENFQFAKGKVKLSIDNEVSEITIPRKTELTIVLETTTAKFATTETITFTDKIAEVNVQALTPGKAGELNQGYSAEWEPLRINDRNLNVSNTEPIELREFGIIEVFVDGIDFKDTNKVSQIKQEIERVRAAGIYAILKPANRIGIDGVFRIELKSNLRFSSAERIEIEEQVEKAIASYLKTQQMGQPLLISQLTRKILDCQNVSDLLDFTLTTTRQIGDKPEINSYPSTIKRLDADILEKFASQSIRVASETKPLIVDLQVQATSLTPDTYKTLLQLLKEYFQRLQVGESITANAIKTQLNAEVQVQLNPHLWKNSGMSFNREEVTVSFVEKGQLGKVFIYSSFLTITGAIKLTLPAAITREDKDKVLIRVRQQVVDYLDRLEEEENIKIEQIINQVRKVDSVLDVNWKVSDFQVLNLENARDRLDIDKAEIRVEPFEKTQLAPDFAIDSDVKLVEISISKLHLRLNATGLLPENIKSDDLKAAMTTTLTSLFTPTLTEKLLSLDTGEDINYEQLRTNFQSLIRDRANNISLATLQTLITSGDNKTQLIDVTRIFLRGAEYNLDILELKVEETTFTQDMPIRIVERAQLQPLNISGENLQIIVEIIGG
ncbi:baseplate J/gp47 family protein [Kamptonema sp. UHCC 0994]|uniref:baseplate J/gp47 family protein n=1 Tax=Kamptonema sp. UHCC 0994 TaxID=3031329 RepID=UPI0023B9DBF3|nr:baseplate J/gp47 family protein [Kamptonema sp. UHCC 0994]MDF0551815.1 baseplate J/gp47 family protein [Kamptonema sp. UHCC 0994]